jgi:hypothetical protein
MGNYLFISPLNRLVKCPRLKSFYQTPGANTGKASILLYFLIGFSLFLPNCHAQSVVPYTSVYNSTSYSSDHRYNLNVVYFLPKDVPLNPTYKTRLSALLLNGQNFYKENMISNGFGPKTFGLFTETAYPDRVKIILIRGKENSVSYPYSDHSKEEAEVAAYFKSNPTQKTSDHYLIITPLSNPAPDPANSNVPFYGIGKTCYAVDYPNFDIKYLGKTSGTLADIFGTWYGGLLHELGHALNVGHSQQTKSELAARGTNLMSDGNYNFGTRKIFINRADCAILNNCQVFASSDDIAYYNGHSACIVNLNAQFVNGNLVVSGTFRSDQSVTDVNVYQDPHAKGNGDSDYHRIAWSVRPVDNSFAVSMPVMELDTMNGPYNLQIELVLQNGEYSLDYLPAYTYANGVSTVNFNLTEPTMTTQPSAQATCMGTTATFTAASSSGNTYQWQYWQGTEWINIAAGKTAYQPYWTFVATNGSLQITPGAQNDVQKVRVIVSNGTCPVTSSEAAFTVTSNTIITQPKAQSTCVGVMATFTAIACGPGNSYQWQYWHGTEWIDIAAGTTAYQPFWTFVASNGSLQITPGAQNDVQKVRVVVSSSAGTLMSGEAMFTVKFPDTIISQPTAQSTDVGKTATFTAAGSGPGNTYQWQYWQGTKWISISAGTTSYQPYWTFAAASGSLQVTPGAQNDVQKVRVIIGNGTCSVVSSEATLTVTANAVTIQPTAQSVCVGTTATFTAASFPGSSFRWQYWQGTKWIDIDAGKTAAQPYWTFVATNGSLQITPGADNDVQKVRVLVSNSFGTFTSKEALLMVYLSITTQPTAQSAYVGAKASFTAVACGAGNTYRWQYWQGTKWIDIATRTTAYQPYWTFVATNGSLQITPGAQNDVQKVRVIVSNGPNTAISSNAAFTVAPNAITSQPIAQSTCTGATATFTAMASGPGNTYQWQYWQGTKWIKIDAGKTTAQPYWTFVATNGSLQVTPGAQNDVQKVRVIVSNSFGTFTSKEAILTIYLSITTQPKSQTTDVGKTVTFVAAGCGIGNTYQWQYWQGTEWIDIAAGTTAYQPYWTFVATNGSLQITPAADNDVRKVRVNVSNGPNLATSFEAALTLNSPIIILPPPPPARIGTISSAEQVFQVSPNPTDGQITVTFAGPQQGPLTLAIRNVSGVELLLQNHRKTGNLFQQLVDLKSVPVGIYFVEIRIGEQGFRKRILKL